MDTPSIFGKRRQVFREVDWRSYGIFLRMFQDRPAVRLTYDREKLEIRGVNFKHERYACLLGLLVYTLTDELDLPIASGGSTTLYLRRKRRGLDPDKCYWIMNESRMRNKAKLDLRIDPPPDLAIEVDIPASCLDRLAIFAALNVPEVWRFDGRFLSFHVLGTNEMYQSVPFSRLFSFVKSEDLVHFLEKQWTMDDAAVVREFRAWVRKRIAMRG